MRAIEGRHFLGAIVCVPENHQPGVVPAYMVIDGQQRLTTLSLLLCAMRDIAKEAGWEELAAEIGENYLIHRHKKGREHYKLYPRQRDRAAYLALVDGKPRVGETQVVAAYDYFVSKIRAENLIENEGKLRGFFGFITTKLDFVAITLGRENPYKIFKSLNSTGVDLDEGDLIRNHVFMGLAVAEQDLFDDEKWRPLERHFDTEGHLDGRAFAAFFRDALMRGGTYIGKDGVYEAFEEKYPSATLKAADVASEFASQVEHHDQVRGTVPHPNAGVNQALREIRDLQVSTAYPLVLALMDKHSDKKLDDASLVIALKAISSFVLRRYVCNLTSRQYGRWFCSASKEIGTDPVNALISFLKTKGWPDDATFIPAFQRLDLYGRTYAKAVLASLELPLQSKSELVALDRCTIEHILPQTVNESDGDGAKWVKSLGAEWKRGKGEWQDTPGNLTLVGYDYNTSMSNKPFDEKQPVLAASKVSLNKYFTDSALKVWDGEAIETRGHKLAEMAAKIWAPPK